MEIIIKVTLDTNLSRKDVRDIIQDKVQEALITNKSNAIELDSEKFSDEDYIEIAEVKLSN